MTSKPYSKGDRLIEFVVDSVFIVLEGLFWGSQMFSGNWGTKFQKIFPYWEDRASGGSAFEARTVITHQGVVYREKSLIF